MKTPYRWRPPIATYRSPHRAKNPSQLCNVADPIIMRPPTLPAGRSCKGQCWAGMSRLWRTICGSPWRCQRAAGGVSCWWLAGDGEIMGYLLVEFEESLSVVLDPLRMHWVIFWKKYPTWMNMIIGVRHDHISPKKTSLHILTYPTFLKNSLKPWNVR
jgi:hypothetical protein